MVILVEFLALELAAIYVGAYVGWKIGQFLGRRLFR